MDEAMWWQSNSENGSNDLNSCGNTPRLPCLVDLGPTLESAVQVEAFPDGGTSCSIISDDSENLKFFQKSKMFAKNLKCF